MAYLLDTNIINDMIRNPAGRVAEHIARVGEDRICTSIIVAAELRYGCAKRRAPELTRRVTALLSELRILPFDRPADRCYGDLRSALEARGVTIGHNDLLIAAHGLSVEATIVTANRREFGRIEGLAVENWLQDAA